MPLPLATRYGFADAPTSAILGDSSLAWTTAAGALADVGTSLSVVSSAAFPSSVQFDILIGLRDATTGLWSNAELRHVTNVSGTTWTVAAGTLSHASGESISHVVTASGLANNPGARTDAGDFQYLNASGRMARLAAPSDGDYALRWTSAVPSYVAVSSGGLSYADLATPPPSTALGSSAAPFDTGRLTGLAVGNVFYDDLASEIPVEVVIDPGSASATIGIFADIYAANLAGATAYGHSIRAATDYHVGLQDATNVQAMNAHANHAGHGTLASLGGIYAQLDNYGAAYVGGVWSPWNGAPGHVTRAAVFEGWVYTSDGLSTYTDVYGLYLKSQAAAATITNFYGIWVEELPAYTNPYYAWFDSRGVRRVKEDATFDSVGQAIEVLYNPLFAKYTAGAVDFERVVLGQWNGNVAEIGAEKGGTGTLRAVKIIGASLDTPATLTANGVAVATQTYVNAQGFVTASSATAFTNKTGAISQWTNDSGYTTPGAVVTYVASLNYTTLAAVAGVGYATATSSTAFSNKSGNISQWTNDSNFTTLAAVAGVGYLTSVTAHNLLSATHGDTTAASVSRGDVLTGQGASAKWARLAKGTANQVLAMDGTATDVIWATVSAGGGGDALVANPLSQFAATTSLQLKGVISDETGSGALVFATSPALVTPVLGVASATSLATSAASPFLLTNGQLVTIALISQTVNPATLTIPNFASISDTFAFLALAQTFTNKRLTKRVVTASDATSITPNSDNADVTYQANTQAAGTLTINIDGGAPTNGQAWLLKIKSTNVQTFAWNGLFVGGTIALPTATAGGATIDYFSFIYDTANTKWHFTGSAAGF